MTLDAKNFIYGGSGLIATLTAEKLSASLAVVIASLTILGLIPLVLTRWKKFLQNKTLPPF